MMRSRGVSLLLLATLVLAGLSCSSDRQPTAPDSHSAVAPQMSGSLLGGNHLVGELLSCSPLPYASTTATIGPAGGTIAVGPHTLSIPAGALSQDVVITAEAPSDSVRSVRLLPEGLNFAAGKPATLTLSYSNCSLLGSLLPKRIVYTTDLLELLQLLPSVDNLLARKVSAPLEHFSRYAISW